MRISDWSSDVCSSDLDIAVRVPEDAAVRLLLKVEQVHLGAQLAMVALAGLLHPVEVRVELLPVEPAGAVDAAQHRVLLVAAPIGARHADRKSTRLNSSH